MSDLNEGQRQAVIAADGPALVLAGAGTGKTRVIVERLVWLAEERGIDPRHLLALTFTNRAAGEMRERVAQRLGSEKVAAWLGTFHSFGLYVLRRELDKLGRKNTFVVYDEADQLGVMKRLVKDLGPAEADVSPREALAWISRLKQDCAQPDWASPCENAEEGVRRNLWKRYHAFLERQSAVDFDDLLVLTVRVFEEHPEVRDKYHQRYRYVLVDEYQDTNHAQYRIGRSLCGSDGNLFVVGDEDQSIYSWRGADIRNILTFEKDFPRAAVFRLEQNYRSTQPILDAANALVAHNEQRLGKTLWTERTQGPRVRYFCAEDGEGEAEFAARDIAERGLAPAEVAVLYRVNTQSRLFEEALHAKGLACVVVGGIRFYARKEIKDLVAYLRLLSNPNDDEALRRVINVPARGIGAKAMESIEGYARDRGVFLYQVLREVLHDRSVGTRLQGEAGEFVRLIDDLALEARDRPVTHVVEAVLEKTGYREYVRTSDEKDSRSRLEAIEEFLRGCVRFDRDNPAGNLPRFVQEIALFTGTDEWRRDLPAVTLMTCHSAKGLEFEHVFLVGLEEGLLPHATAVDSKDEVEEERRLCYVAMTRARASLTLTSAEARLLYGTKDMRTPSRFIEEIPARLVSPVEAVSGGVLMPGEQSRGVATESLKTGTRIRHAKFGAGTVMYTAGSGDKLKAYIRFETGRTRMFMVERTPLEIVEGRRR